MYRKTKQNGYKKKMNSRNARHTRDQNNTKPKTKTKTNTGECFKTDTLLNLKSFMMTGDFIQQIKIRYKTTNDFLQYKKIKVVHKDFTHRMEKPQTEKTTKYSPLEDDKLFWIFFILHYGKDDYDETKRTFKHEKNLKYTLISKIQDKVSKITKEEMKTLTKQIKCKPSETINHLGNNISLLVVDFVFLCYLFNINICLVKNKLAKFHLFNKMKSSYYKVDIVNNTVDIEACTKIDIESNDRLFETTNLEKPLKSVSSYKLHDLQTIAELLEISVLQDSGKKKTKQILYTEINEVFS